MTYEPERERGGSDQWLQLQWLLEATDDATVVPELKSLHTPETLMPQNTYPGALSRAKEKERASQSGVLVATAAVAGQTHPFPL